MYAVLEARGNSEAELQMVHRWLSVISFGNHASHIRAIAADGQSNPHRALGRWMMFFMAEENFRAFVQTFTSEERDIVLKFQEAVAAVIAPAPVSYLEAKELLFIIGLVEAQQNIDHINDSLLDKSHQAKTAHSLNKLLEKVRSPEYISRQRIVVAT